MGGCLSNPSNSLSGSLEGEEYLDEENIPRNKSKSLAANSGTSTENLAKNSSFKLPEFPKVNYSTGYEISKIENDKPKELEFKRDFILEKRKSYIKRDENPSQIYKIPSQSRKGNTSAIAGDTFSLPVQSKSKKTVFGNDNDPTRSKGRKNDDSIGIVCFEIANIIARALNLHSSLLEKDLEELQTQVLEIDGIKLLVSNDMKELWKIVALDKRKELRMIAKEVARLGRLSSDPKFYNLWNNFLLLGTSKERVTKKNEEEVLSDIQFLETQAHTTSELYHEITTFESLRQNYLKKGADDEENLTSSQKATLNKLKKDIKNHESKIALLKATGLWLKKLDKILESLEEMIYFLYHQIVHVFEDRGVHALPFNYTVDEDLEKNKLGVCGLSLHYANVINLIDNLVSRPMIVPQTRENLYHMLPIGVKQKLKKKLLNSTNLQFETTEDLKDKLEETLDWLATMAGNTLRFGADFRLQGHTELTELQTLYHADREKTESMLVQLLIGLQHLASRNSNSVASDKISHSSPIPRLPTVAPIPAIRDRSLPAQQNVANDNGNGGDSAVEDDSEDEFVFATSSRGNGGESIMNDNDGVRKDELSEKVSGKGKKLGSVNEEEEEKEGNEDDDHFDEDLGEEWKLSKSSKANESSESNFTHLFLPPKRLPKVNTKHQSFDEKDNSSDTKSPNLTETNQNSPSVKSGSNSKKNSPTISNSRHKKTPSREKLMKQEMLNSLPKDELERIEELATQRRPTPFISHSMEHVRMDAAAAKTYAQKVAERKKSHGYLPNVHMDVITYLPDGQPVRVFSPRLTRSLSRSHTYSANVDEEVDDDVYSRLHFVKPMTPHKLDVDRVQDRIELNLRR